MDTFTAENTRIGQFIAMADENDQPAEIMEVAQCDGELAHLVDPDGDTERFVRYPFTGWLQVGSPR